MAWRRPGDKPLSEPRMESLLTHICVTRPQWVKMALYCLSTHSCCPACRAFEIATRFWDVVICPIYMCLTVYEFSFILFDLCLFITIFNFTLNYILIVTFWIFTYYKIWIMLISYCFMWNYWIIYFVTCVWKCCGVLWVNWCQFAVDKVGLG